MKTTALLQQGKIASQVPSVDNIRCISEINPRAKPNLLLRCACPVAMNEADAAKLKSEFSLSHLIDLRAEEEIKDDDGIEDSLFKRELKNDLWYSRPARSKTDRLLGLVGSREVHPVRLTVQNRGPPTVVPDPRGLSFESGDSESEDSGALPSTSGTSAAPPLTRHVISLLDRGRFIKALLRRLPFPTVSQVVVVGAVNKEHAKRVMMQEVNKGGLELLYEILLESSGPEIAQVLRILTQHAERGEGCMVFCKAGKDRTGVIMALVQSVLGTPREAIVRDYALSDHFKRVALAGMEKQGQDLAGVDRNKFMGAPPEAMEHALSYIDDRYGSIAAYLCAIDFDSEWQERLRKALLIE